MIRSLLKMEKVTKRWPPPSGNRGPAEFSCLSLRWAMFSFARGDVSGGTVVSAGGEAGCMRTLRLYLGLARIYRAYSFYGQAYACLKRAHEIAPGNPEVQRLWFGELPRKDRIAAIDTYLAAPHSPEETSSLQNYLAFLKATAAHPTRVNWLTRWSERIRNWKIFSPIQRTNSG